MTSLLDIIANKTGQEYRRAAAGEHMGPCPWCGGEDRFRIFSPPKNEGYWCRKCGKEGDAIQFAREYLHMGFAEAKEFLGLPTDDHNNNNHHNNHNGHNHHNGPARADIPKGISANRELKAPSDSWRAQGMQFVMRCQKNLMERNVNPRALEWLHDSRRLADDTIWHWGLGYNEKDSYDDPGAWGLAERKKRVWLPRGIVIPWLVDAELWGIRIRRPAGSPKYYWIPGGEALAMYGADNVSAAKPVALFEGEFDAMLAWQEVGDSVTPVATGSTQGCRRIRWLARLAAAPLVLVAYDNDNGGEEGAKWWVDALSNGHRWRPYWSDPTDVARQGGSIRAWILAGLARYRPLAGDSSQLCGVNDLTKGI